MRYLLGIFSLFLFSACNINSNIIFKDTKNTEYIEAPLKEQKEYKIAPNDKITFRFYKNNGFEMLGGNMEGSSNGSSTISDEYTVETDGNVKLPYLGKVKLSGKTLREAEAFLETEYSEIFVNPFILIEVTNKRAIVSRGNGLSQIVQLTNENMTVIEVISVAGGIDTRGKANSIKVLRKTESGPREIFKLDLSTTEGLEMADMAVQANDIIYVEPRKSYGTEVLREIAPYLSIISSAVLLFSVSRNITR